jgi:hypothetical protein
MKRFTDGTVRVRRLSRQLMLGVVTAILAGASACGSHNSPNCPNMAISTEVLGQATFGTGNPNAPNGVVSAAGVNGPFGSPAIKSDGSLIYIADPGDNRILGYNGVPAKSGANADFELGQGGNSTDFTDIAHAATPTALTGPLKVAIGTDTVGNEIYLVVTDTGNNRVLIWNATLHGNTLPGSTYYPPDVVVGQPDFNSGSVNQGNTAPSAGTLNHPTSAAIANGMLFVVDEKNNRVLIWNTVPTTNGVLADIELGQLAQNTTLGNCSSNTGPTAYCFTTSQPNIDTFSNNGQVPTYTLEMDLPTDIISDGSTFLMISDTLNHRVIVYKGVPNTNNAFPDSVIGQTAFARDLSGSGTQGLNAPTGVNYQNGFIYIADTGNNRVLAYQVSPIQVASNGEAAGYIYGQEDFAHVSFNDVDQNGAPGNQNTSNNGNSNTLPAFNVLHTPTGMYNDNAGHAYITDTGNNRLLQFANSPNVSAASPTSGTQPQNCNGTNPQY